MTANYLREKTRSAADWFLDVSNSTAGWKPAERIGAAEFLYYAMEHSAPEKRERIRPIILRLVSSVEDELRAAPVPQNRELLARSYILWVLVKGVGDSSSQPKLSRLEKLCPENGVVLMLLSESAWISGKMSRCVELMHKAMAAKNFHLYDKGFRFRIMLGLRRAGLLDDGMKRGIVALAHPLGEVWLFVRHTALLGFLDTFQPWVRRDLPRPARTLFPRKYLSLVALDRPVGFDLDIHAIHQAWVKAAEGSSDGTKKTSESASNLTSRFAGEPELLERTRRTFLKETDAIERMALNARITEIDALLENPERWREGVLQGEMSIGELRMRWRRLWKAVEKGQAEG